MKQFSLTLIFALLSLSGMAQRFDYLTLRATDGSQQSVKIDLGTVITFADGVMTTTTAGESQSFNLTDISAFFFSAEPTAINLLELSNAKVSLSANQLSVHGPQAAIVQVFAANGQLVAAFTKSTAGAEVFGVNLPGGVYVVKVNGQTSKLMVR